MVIYHNIGAQVTTIGGLCCAAYLGKAERGRKFSVGVHLAYFLGLIDGLCRRLYKELVSRFFSLCIGAVAADLGA